MSLVVWLPLNGNLENQGLSNVTVTNNGATVDNNGKIGKCYKFDGSNNRIYTSDLNLDCSKLSLACWFYRDSSSTAEGYIASLNNGSGYADCAIGLDTSNATTLVFVAGGNSSLTKTFTANQWHHAVVTFNGSTITGYLDGEKVGTSTGTPLTKTLLTIGARANSTTGAGNAIAYPFKGKLNDFRIYDHCLSAKEVGELAKGLVLHYRLAGPGQENLVPNSNYNNYTATPNSIGASLDSSVLWNGMPTLKLSQSGNTSNVYRGFSVNILNSLTKGEKYTMTVYAYTKDKSLLDSGMEVRIYQQRANGASTLWGNLSYSLINNSWVKIQGTYTIDTNAINAIVNMQIVKNGTVWFSPVKVEKGSISTPWCPHKNDALYSIMGYNNNIEYDCSGYRRNGAKSGTITWDINSARYATSYKFGANSYICAGDKCRPIDAITVAWWGYLSNWSNYNRAISCTEGGGWNFEPNSSKMSFPLYQAGVGYIRALDSMDLSSLSSGWHHWAATFDKGVVKLYRDGTLVNTYISPSQNGIQYNTSTGLFIGAEAGGSLTSPDSTGTFNGGNLADVRIYATALSAEDIAELYHSAVIVDNTGKNYAYEYFEA